MQKRRKEGRVFANVLSTIRKYHPLWQISPYKRYRKKALFRATKKEKEYVAELNVMRDCIPQI